MKANWETGNKRGRKQSYRQEVKQKTTQQRKKNYQNQTQNNKIHIWSPEGSYWTYCGLF